MFGLIDDIQDYNRRFSEETKGYKKFCKGKECQNVDECDRQGRILFCERNDEQKALYYIEGRHDSGIFSLKNLCKRDGFINGYMDMEMLNGFWRNVEKKFPEILPSSIDVWIEELKEMGMFKE